jgi:hypothetical protein
MLFVYFDRFTFVWFANIIEIKNSKLVGGSFSVSTKNLDC